MRILHTESSNGWGGQEIRILKESEGMRQRGHEVILVVEKGGGLVEKAKEKGFTVYELSFRKKHALAALGKLMFIMRKHNIDLINTHSSLDAWLAGIAARMLRKKIIRTRHLSTPIRKGINSRLLYNRLADFVVTTSSGVIPAICSQAQLSPSSVLCIPTGVDPASIRTTLLEIQEFREKLKLRPEDVLVGTACFVRSWKGIHDFMQAVKILKDVPNLKWVIVGGGYVNDYKGTAEKLGIMDVLTFTGHLDKPFPAIAAMDIFALLSTAHEGISQASLQAAYLERPMITTPIGGLPEVCLEGKTGLQVPVFSPEKFAEAVLKLMNDPLLRKQMGSSAKKLVEEKFTLKNTLDQMEVVYNRLVEK